jgi:DNA-binding MarR family transcriptional regulator
MDSHADPAVELLKILPELAVALYRAAPHEHAHAAPPGAAAVTPRQMEAVVQLATYGRQTMGELADGLDVSKAAASEMVERLVAKGLVRRDVSASDRRVVTVEVATDAQPHVGQAIDRWRGQLQAVLARFPGVEPTTLIAFLAALTDELKRGRSDA